MRHESERAGQGTRGSEGERGQEPERGKGVGATGGRGDCRNKAGKGKKGQYYRSTPHQGSASLLTIDGLSFVWQVVRERQEGRFA